MADVAMVLNVQPSEMLAMEIEELARWLAMARERREAEARANGGPRR
ncbi:GpE family phage tail protein [Sediminimonas sp.]|nr:GpE family phage tail protein [Sediminimonas sp.]